MAAQKKKISPKFSPMTVIMVVFFLFFLLRPLATLITDYWWFEHLGYASVFATQFSARLLLFAATAVLVMAFLSGTVFLATRKKEKTFISRRFKIFAASVFAAVTGVVLSGYWEVFYLYKNMVPFPLADPIFGKNLSFYVFTLPLWNIIVSVCLATAAAAIILVAVSALDAFIKELLSGKPYRTPEGIEVLPRQEQGFSRVWERVSAGIMIQLALLSALVFALLAVRHYLARFSILYSSTGVVYGAGYTDRMIILPAHTLLVLVCAGSALALLGAAAAGVLQRAGAGSGGTKKGKSLLFSVLPVCLVVYAVVLIGGTIILPGIVQSVTVSPNELVVEQPYIENSIRFTRYGYGLTNVTEIDYAVGQESLSVDEDSFASMRVVDWRPLKATYKQLQEIRLYYDFADVDIDRYNFNNKTVQVMLSARDLSQNQILENAQTWVNLHTVYTHGYGAVMSPVNRVTEEGLPIFHIKDIPPVVTEGYEEAAITRPEIYYGEIGNSYVFVNTKSKEFDYPKGDLNMYSNYTGRGGVVIDGFFKKALFALRFGDVKMLLSDTLTPKSRVVLYRDIQDRVRKIAPFLYLDDDPYLVIADGKLYWLQDAYTTTSKIPYSQPFNRFNYLRNAAKIVVDVYSGDVTIYLTDNEDPLVRAYAQIFPSLFAPYEKMPPELKKHIRYPEDLFRVQSSLYALYHMEDPSVFYNKEDAWDIPFEIYGTGQKIKAEPYYALVRLPGEEKEGFVILTAFTPRKKDNMIAWMAGRSDPGEYGQLVLYKFPKDALVFGPFQIEAKIDQDSIISEQLTLWDQRGSQVTRGNLLVIPVNEGILYIEPLYIQAENGQIPELKRVIVSDGSRVVMEKDLATALRVLLGAGAGQKPQLPSGEPQGPGTDQTTEELISQASEAYDAIAKSMREQDWSGIGSAIKELGEILSQLQAQKASSSVP